MQIGLFPFFSHHSQAHKAWGNLCILTISKSLEAKPI